MTKPANKRTHKEQAEARHVDGVKRTTTHPRRQARRERAYARGAPRPKES